MILVVDGRVDVDLHQANAMVLGVLGALLLPRIVDSQMIRDRISGDFKVAFPDLDRETFPYRFISVKGRIEGELLIGDEVTVDSKLINLSGHGKVDLERKQIDGKGLIAVLKPIDEVITRIPVISSMVGGSLVGIPVRVTGSLERPHVTYLSPSDVGVELLNIPLRILGMPLGAMFIYSKWRPAR